MMKTRFLFFTALALTQVAFAKTPSPALPAELSKEDLAGEIFERDDMIQTRHDDGHVTLDVTSMLSSDKKFSSGM